MSDDRELLLQVLQGGPAFDVVPDGAAWTRVIQQARGAGLMPALALHLDRSGALEHLSPPPAVRGHLESARRVALAQEAEVRRELRQVAAALRDLGEPVVLLKGAAYVAAGLPCARGRLFSDIDLLVPKAAVAQAESQLMLAGWMTTHLNAYDQHYYREWMHELPPLQHVRRGTTLDLHHTIVPPTSRFRLNARHLFEQSRELPEFPGMRVLCPEDMVLHCATHLFLNDDTSHALRDLRDFHQLIALFGERPSFWDDLVARARLLGLGRLLHYALRHSGRLLRSQVPASVLAATAGDGPAWPVKLLMNALWRRALRSPHESAALPLTGAALFGLYLRGHWLRMPPHLLVRHLTIKALRLHERHETGALRG